MNSFTPLLYGVGTFVAVYLIVYGIIDIIIYLAK